ncbi:ROK family protein [Sinosporangium siamense]|uniref:ROK family protein n=1 Tax=Sinosporangium siamense TaxID=1367973 RepID=A0A919RIK2_9ACTN|nr:ROK family protein [Sinosporangium siamense]GII92636.1 hypothetical protein Ssi02_28670 [Sinosporangium siamense]
MSGVIGIDLGGTKCHGALGDAAGAVLAEFRTGTDVPGGAGEVLTLVWRRLRREAEDRGIDVRHATVGIPAVFDPVTGQASQGTNIGWEGFDVAAVVETFEVPVLVENDANLAGLAEATAGNAVGVPDFVLLSLGTGFGGALFAGGELVRGARGAAAEFGEMLLADPEGGLVRAEDRVSGLALRDDARKLVTGDAGAAAELGEVPTAQTVIAGAVRGERHARLLVEEMLDALALVVVNICATTDPRLVVLDGGMGRALAPFTGALASRVAGLGVSSPRVAVSSLYPNATISGALQQSVRYVERCVSKANLL